MYAQYRGRSYTPCLYSRLEEEHHLFCTGVFTYKNIPLLGPTTPETLQKVKSAVDLSSIPAFVLNLDLQPCLRGLGFRV